MEIIVQKYGNREEGRYLQLTYRLYRTCDKQGKQGTKSVFNEKFNCKRNPVFFLISMPADSSDLVLMHCLCLRLCRPTIISLLSYRADTATAISLVWLESC